MHLINRLYLTVPPFWGNGLAVGKQGMDDQRAGGVSKP